MAPGGNPARKRFLAARNGAGVETVAFVSTDRSMVSDLNVEKSCIKRNCYLKKPHSGPEVTHFPGRRGVFGDVAKVGAGHFLYYPMMMGFDAKRLRKVGLAGFFFFLLKGLVWLLIFLFAWSEV